MGHAATACTDNWEGIIEMHSLSHYEMISDGVNDTVIQKLGV